MYWNLRFIWTPYCLLPTPWSRVLLEKLTGFQLAKKSPASHGTLRFTATSTSACHLSLFKYILSSPYHIVFIYRLMSEGRITNDMKEVVKANLIFYPSICCWC